MRIARELSNLVIYCRSVVFNSDRAYKREGRNHTEMSSFPEVKAEKVMVAGGDAEAAKTFLWYHSAQLSRVYPKVIENQRLALCHRQSILAVAKKAVPAINFRKESCTLTSIVVEILVKASFILLPSCLSRISTFKAGILQT